MFTRGQRYEKRYSLVLFCPFFYLITNEKCLKNNATYSFMFVFCYFWGGG